MDVDDELLTAVVGLATDAGNRLLAVFAPDARPTNKAELVRAAVRNEHASSNGLREALSALRPEARFVDGEFEAAPLPDDGEWWVVDNAEGSVNHVHGLPDWGVSIALIVAGKTVLAVFRQPIGDLTYTARVGGGAWLNGRQLHTSLKEGLEIAIVGTGQAEADQTATYDRIGRSITVLLERAFVVRSTVPTTFPMLLVAAGKMDAFWQYDPVLPGVAVGSLLITEGGGIVSTVRGEPWKPGLDTILVGAPAVHPAVRDALATID